MFAFRLGALDVVGGRVGFVHPRQVEGGAGFENGKRGMEERGVCGEVERWRV